jgi:hypothetical protein
VRVDFRVKKMDAASCSRGAVHRAIQTAQMRAAVKGRPQLLARSAHPASTAVLFARERMDGGSGHRMPYVKAIMRLKAHLLGAAREPAEI